MPVTFPQHYYPLRFYEPHYNWFNLIVVPFLDESPHRRLEPPSTAYFNLQSSALTGHLFLPMPCGTGSTEARILVLVSRPRLHFVPQLVAQSIPERRACHLALLNSTLSLTNREEKLSTVLMFLSSDDVTSFPVCKEKGSDSQG